MPSSSSFKDLRVWQDAMKLALEVYASTSSFPKHELYGLAQQMRRAAVSIPSNIAEGKGHRSDREFNHFLFHARGSLLELQTQILIAQELQYLPEVRAQHMQELANGVGRTLNGLINSLSTTAA
ncbi:MAG: four helix bundle protein [Terriglobales bacterium]